MSNDTDPTSYTYDVALSVAGEDLHHARALAAELMKARVRVFLYAHEPERLWGRDLRDELPRILVHGSRYFVPFISRHYVTKHWTRTEFATASKLSAAGGGPTILPIRVDNTDVDGLPDSVVYQPVSSGAEALCRALLGKLDTSHLRQYNKSNPHYGGTVERQLTREFVEDAGSSLQQHLDDMMLTGLMAVLPALECSGQLVSPRLNRWPLGPCNHDLIARTLVCPDHIESCDVGGYVLELTSSGNLGTQVRLDPAGLVVGSSPFEFRYGGEIDLTLPDSAREQDIATVVSSVEAKMRSGFLVVFPALSIEGSSVSPKLNRWPEDFEEYEQKTLVEGLLRPGRIRTADGGFLVEYSGPWLLGVEVHLDAWGRVLEADAFFDGSA